LGQFLRHSAKGERYGERYALSTHPSLSGKSLSGQLQEKFGADNIAYRMEP
jgi:hypothetical protein